MSVCHSMPIKELFPQMKKGPNSLFSSIYLCRLFVIWEDSIILRTFFFAARLRQKPIKRRFIKLIPIVFRFGDTTKPWNGIMATFWGVCPHNILLLLCFSVAFLLLLHHCRRSLVVGVAGKVLNHTLQVLFYVRPKQSTSITLYIQFNVILCGYLKLLRMCPFTTKTFLLFFLHTYNTHPPIISLCV